TLPKPPRNVVPGNKPGLPDSRRLRLAAGWRLISEWPQRTRRLRPQRGGARLMGLRGSTILRAVRLKLTCSRPGSITSWRTRLWLLARRTWPPTCGARVWTCVLISESRYTAGSATRETYREGLRLWILKRTSRISIGTSTSGGTWLPRGRTCLRVLETRTNET